MLNSTAYKDLTALCKHLVSKYKLHVEPEEIISEAYILASTENINPELSEISGCINKVCWQLKQNQLHSIKLNEQSSLDETKFCRKCKEDKPIAAFGVTIRKKTGAKIIQYCCSECQAKIMAVLQNDDVFKNKHRDKKRKLSLNNYYAKRDTPEYKAYRAAYMRERYRRKKQPACLC